MVRFSLLCTATLIFPILLFAQDTTVAWTKNIDTLAFKIIYNKKKIPKFSYKAIQIESIKEVANSGEPYSAGCVWKKGYPRLQLQWIAKDIHNHWVICIAHGGLHHGYNYYFFDKDKGTLNINEFRFREGVLTFSQTVERILSGKYEREVFTY